MTPLSPKVRAAYTTAAAQTRCGYLLAGKLCRKPHDVIIWMRHEMSCTNQRVKCRLCPQRNKFVLTFVQGMACPNLIGCTKYDERERETKRKRDRDKARQRQIETETKRQRQRDRDKERQTQRETKKEDRDRGQRQNRDRQTDRVRQTESDRQSQTDRVKQTETDTKAKTGLGGQTNQRDTTIYMWVWVKIN